MCVPVRCALCVPCVPTCALTYIHMMCTYVTIQYIMYIPIHNVCMICTYVYVWDVHFRTSFACCKSMEELVLYELFSISTIKPKRKSKVTTCGRACQGMPVNVDWYGTHRYTPKLGKESKKINENLRRHDSQDVCFVVILRKIPGALFNCDLIVK